MQDFGFFKMRIVGLTIDRASVMKKFGHENPIEKFLCLNHAIHLAVVDVLFTV